MNLLILILFCTSSALPWLGSNNVTSMNGYSHDIVKRNLDIFSIVSSSAESVNKLWSNINNDRDSAKVKIELRNYSKYFMNIIFAKRIHGEMDRIPNFIEPGTCETMVGWGDGKFDPSEGVLGVMYHLTSYCLIYWRVEHERMVAREPNRIGVSCFDTNEEATDFANAIVDAKDEGHENKNVTSLQWTYAFNEIHSVQYCGEDFCFRGTMPSTHQPTVYVSLFPLVASDWYSYNNDTHDTIVDAINSMNATVYEFDHEPSTRKALNKSWLEPLSYIGACLGSFLLFLFIYLVLPDSQKNSIRKCFTAAKRKLCCCCPCSNKPGGCYL